MHFVLHFIAFLFDLNVIFILFYIQSAYNKEKRKNVPKTQWQFSATINFYKHLLYFWFLINKLRFLGQMFLVRKRSAHETAYNNLNFRRLLRVVFTPSIFGFLVTSRQPCWWSRTKPSLSLGSHTLFSC